MGEEQLCTGGNLLSFYITLLLWGCVGNSGKHLWKVQVPWTDLRCQFMITSSQIFQGWRVDSLAFDFHNFFIQYPEKEVLYCYSETMMQYLSTLSHFALSWCEVDSNCGTIQIFRGSIILLLPQYSVKFNSQLSLSMSPNIFS